MPLKDESQKQRNFASQQAQGALWWQPAIEILAKVTGLIVGPIVIALFVGRWLDERYNSGPWLFLASLGVAFAISSIGIIKITLDYIKKIENKASSSVTMPAGRQRSLEDKSEDRQENKEKENE